jgi:hypothetical protein
MNNAKTFLELLKSLQKEKMAGGVAQAVTVPA